MDTVTFTLEQFQDFLSQISWAVALSVFIGLATYDLTLTLLDSVKRRFLLSRVEK